MKQIYIFLLITTLSLKSWSAMSLELSFTRACESTQSINIAAVGDLLFHQPLQEKAYQMGGFKHLWPKATPYLQLADITYGNLEGPAAYGVNESGKDVADPGLVFDDIVYTAYPQFNYNPIIAFDLVDSGFDIVSTANNHSLDRSSLGILRTIEALDNAGLPFTGTKRQDGSEESWHHITSTAGFNVAWVACTYDTNGIKDKKKQVLFCFKDREELLELVHNLAMDTQIDAVIVTPHWGEELSLEPNKQQVRLGRELLEAGALAVLGSHPHVLQPWEKYLTKDGRETFIIYSMGNFVAGQEPTVKKRTGMILYLGLSRGNDGKVFINGVKYIATMFARPAGMNPIPLEDMELELLDWVSEQEQTPLQKESKEFISKIFPSSLALQPNQEIRTNSECY